jgi:hypothetical protein
MGSFDQLMAQIDAFIRKFYKNEMVKGGILVSGFLLLSFLLVIGFEYIGRFSSVVRAMLFFGFIAVNLFLIMRYFLIPLFKIFSFGKRINRYQASVIIGQFFPEISDRVLNTLQLHDATQNVDGNLELIRASINQRSKTLTAIPFSTGIDLKKNWKYVKFVAPVVVAFLAVLIFFPSIIKQGTTRVVNYDKQFKEEAPFQFLFSSTDSYYSEGSDVPIELMLKGSAIPEKVYLVTNQGKFLMNPVSKIAHRFTLKKMTSSSSLYFEANGFRSAVFDLKIVPKSAIGKFAATLSYPSYLGKKDEIVSNAGDLEIPEGTFVRWDVFTANSSEVSFVFPSEKQIFKKDGFSVKKKFTTSSNLTVSLKNAFTASIDSSSYKINVIKDAYPLIEVSEEKDSISSAIRFFSGKISDDYGLNSLQFVYTISSSSGKSKEFRVPVVRTVGTEMTFTHAVDFRRENLNVKDKIDYYFVVSDNDGVNGSKSSRSQLYTYELPSLEELNDLRDSKVEDSKKNLSDLMKKAADFKKNVEFMKKDIMNSKSSDWNKKNQLQQLQEQQQQIQQELEQLQMKMAESLDEKNQLSELDKELLEKQELLQKLMEELMDQEMMDLFKQLEELMQKQDNKQIQEKMDALDMKAEDMNKQLDRSLEMFKRMQVNEKLDDIQKELDQLAKEQFDLNKAIEAKKLDIKSAEQKQDDLNKKFDDIKEDLNKLEDLNQELKTPIDLGNQEDEKKSISDDMNESKENLSKNKSQKAGEKQKSAADGMKKLSEQLEKKQQEANKKQNEEDINSLRNILKSLMTLSFSQEDVMLRFAKVKDNDPYYKKLGRRQRSIVDDTKLVEDSLESLAMRNPKIAKFIDQELNLINSNFKLGIENIDEHRRRELGQNLQFVMTGYNNLALMLNESLQQMQAQMNSESSGSGSCDNPGGKGKKPKSGDSPGDLKDMLKKQLEQMKKGQNPGGKSPGDKPGEGEGQQGMMGLGNQQIAKMAAQQTAIRQRLEQMRNELNKEGKGQGNQLNPLIKELEQQEKDLINKKFSNGMIRRQQEILTRLLESEKALLERGFEDKRESKEGKNLNYSNQKRIDEYTQQKLKQIELLKSVDPLYRKYYKDKAFEYFNLGL